MTGCGECTLCCNIVPVAEIGLKAFTRCQHERNFPFAKPGCAIYPTRPRSCRVWSCQWLVNAQEGAAWGDDLRPDRCGVVVDTQLDLIRLTGPGERREISAVQMWAAPGHEEDYRRDPMLAVVLAVLDRYEGAVIWRYRGPDGGQIAIGLTRDGQGRLAASPPTPPDIAFSAEIPTEERIWRATLGMVQRERKQ